MEKANHWSEGQKHEVSGPTEEQAEQELRQANQRDHDYARKLAADAGLSEETVEEDF